MCIRDSYEGEVPAFDENLDIVGAESEDDISFHDAEMLRLFDNVDSLCACLRKYDFRGGLRILMEISSQGNQILQFNEPWKTIKTEPELVKVVINLMLQYVKVISVVIRPFLPFTSDKLTSLLNLEAIKESGELLALCNSLAEGELLLPIGHKINEPEHLFTRIDDEVITEQVNKLMATVPKTTPEETSTVKETIQYDDFMKMDLRVATITAAEKVKKADKLLQLTLDVGFEQRTVVSGIAQHFSPEQVVGQKVTLLANLAPRKIRGVESKGMILMAENDDGSLKFVEPGVESENGAGIS